MQPLVSSQYYHIYNHGNGDDNLFREERNYPFFLEKYHQHIDPIADTIAWCLMPNHFHLLVKIKDEEIFKDFPKFEELLKFETLEVLEAAKSKFISKQFSNFFSSYSQSFNKVYNRRGSLFLKNFRRKLIDSDNYLITLIGYIHLNPVKHGFAHKINDWGRTSFSSFFNDQNKLACQLFQTKENYDLFHKEKLSLFEEYHKIEDEILTTTIETS